MSDPTILLVDDDSDLLSVLGQRCRSIGFQVQTAHNLLTATATVERRPPDVICVDVRMPTGNGLRFCESLADGVDTAHVPIIVLTGQRDEATRQWCRRLGAHYVAKRTDVWNELESLLRKLVPGLGAENRQRAANGKAVTTGGPPVVTPRTVVIADDDTDLVESLTARFAQMDCSVFSAHSALDAINLIHRKVPDLVCLDVNMPAGNGLSVCEMMVTDERLRSLPVIVMTGNADENTIRRCHDMMVYYVEKGRDIWSRIEPLARELLSREQGAGSGEQKKQKSGERRSATVDRADDALLDAVFAMLGGEEDVATGGPPIELSSDEPPTAAGNEPPWVLTIDDDADFSDALKCRLESYGVAVIRAFSGMEGYRLAFTNPANAVLLDYNMPNGQGDYILGRLKDNPVTRDIPVIVITGVRDKMLERKMYNLGASAFLTKPIRFDTLRDELARHIDVLAAPVEFVNR